MEPFRRGGPGRARPGNTATLPSESGTVAPSTGGSGAPARALPSGRLSLSASPPGAPALQSSSPLTLTTLGQMSKNKLRTEQTRTRVQSKDRRSFWGQSPRGELLLLTIFHLLTARLSQFLNPRRSR